MAAVEVRKVRKVYRRDAEEITVLDGIDLDVPDGEFLALMGPSGSGKTTLLNLIAGIDRPSAGTVTVAGTELSGLSEGDLARWRSRHVGFIFQFYNLIPVLTAEENVELPLLLTSLGKAERRTRALTALKVVGLADRAKHYPRQLSGGQEQRVAIARAIVTDPKVLVADEPTGDLDAKSAEEILALMETLNKDFGKTIVMVTHDPRAAHRAHRQYHLDKGVLSRMKYLPYVLKHLRKNKVRTVSTVMALAVCIFLFCTLQTVLAAVAWGLQSASTRRLVTRHAVSLVFNMPVPYGAKIAALPGVRSVAIANWFGGFLKEKKAAEPTDGQADTQDWGKFFPNFAVDGEKYLAMYPEYVIPDDQKKAFLADRRGCVIGRETAARYRWKVGDVFYLESFIPPYRKGEPFEFVIDAIYDTDDLKYPGTDASQMFFHYEYLDEAVKDNQIGVGTFVVEIEDPDRAGGLSKEIDALFANSSAESHTETEAAFRAGFIAMAGNLAVLLNGIGLAVTFTILLVTANTMSMAVRERRTEIGVLKTLGFPSGTVMGLILAESVALGALGGAVGVGAGFAGLGILGHVPAVGDVLRQFQAAGLGLSPLVAGSGFALSLAIGAAAGFVPALLAFRARITDILRAA